MKRFETLDGETLGATFCGDLGTSQDGSQETRRTLMQSKDEAALMWSLDEDTTILEDGHERRLGDIMDWFRSTCKLATAEELERRGWGDRIEIGLGFRTAISETGQLITIR